ncbi:hypothetical protein ACH40E_29715 [Streptomyces acidicola]|uniref:hypothetical protein n=1 Tax=Streptomyces acidicola TaxID=2596892 RepID=UPI003789BF52
MAPEASSTPSHISGMSSSGYLGNVSSSVPRIAGSRSASATRALRWLFHQPAAARSVAGRTSSSARHSRSTRFASRPAARASLRRSPLIGSDGGTPPAVRRRYSLVKRRSASSAGTRAASRFAYADSSFTGSASAGANSRDTSSSRSSSTTSPCSASALRARVNNSAAHVGLFTARNTRPACS